MGKLFSLVLVINLASCKEISRLKRSPSPLNTQYYQIVPKLERRNVWESTEYDYEDELDGLWKDINIDGDFGMRSPTKSLYSKNYYGKYYKDRSSNRRQRNMKFQHKKKTSALRRSELERQEDNEILGSGNFVVVKGGTFYGNERVLHHSGYPKNYGNYYGRNQFRISKILLTSRSIKEEDTNSR